MRVLEVPVLIVGAGPTGLMAALLLEQQGIETALIEKRPGPQRAPAAHVVNARTLEICRAAGVDMAALARAAKDPADAGRVYWVKKLGGEPLGSLPFEQQGDDQLRVTPTPLRNLSQSRFEPLLLEALRKHGREPQWSRRWESAEQVGDRVHSRVADVDGSEPLEIRSRYLLAADGAGSRIRKAVGIEVEGPERIQSFVMVHFRAALREQVGTPPGVLFFVCDPGSGGGGFVIHDLDSEAAYMIPFDPDQESAESFDEARCAAAVRSALEDPELDFEIETISTWAMTAQVAARYREGPTFLLGDAAHRFPPTGGLGLNTGVQDAHNLAWKLSEVLGGRAPETFLDSYESERRPIARNNADQSLRNALRLFEVPLALGITDTTDASRTRMEETLATAEGRARVSEAIANQAEHFDMPGLQLGFAYTDGPPPDPRRFVPSGAPGHRLPHTWLETAGGRESLLDRVPLDRFLLVAGPAGEEWLEACGERVAALRLTPELAPGLSDWLTRAGIEDSGALLVRPDQHVAWRATRLPANPARALSDAVREALEGA